MLIVRSHKENTLKLLKRYTDWIYTLYTQCPIPADTFECLGNSLCQNPFQ